jgi:hypothetical protein
VRVASAILFITVGLAALGLVLLPQDRWLTLESVGQVAGNGLFMLACSAVGILIVARRPGNVIGWIYLLVPLVMAPPRLPVATPSARCPVSGGWRRSPTSCG